MDSNAEDLCKTTVPKLIGFDWNLKVVIGSSSLATLQQPLLGVDFYLSKPTASVSELTPKSCVNHLSIEMNQAELKNLITVLEKANNS